MDETDLNSSDHPINEAYERLRQINRTLLAKQKYSDRNRYSLLMCHATIGLVTGLVILWKGGPVAFTEVEEYTSHLSGLMAAAGGWYLFKGLLTNRDIRCETLGLLLLLMWDLWMSTGFAYSYFITKETSSPYTIVVYGGLGVMMIVHLSTIYYFIRESTAHARPDKVK